MSGDEVDRRSARKDGREVVALRCVNTGGTFVIECEGQRVELAAGSFNYVPKKMAHEAWTKADEGTVLFITVDQAWDINWVGGPPKPEDFSPGLPR